ncbi:helix-turn-helix transcriptional regulator [Lysinibacillus sp. SGAir0095]|uniref:helix-turn-helix transcriptional regulator n=1 Tax=Lysinibacillus sp. SGAir0095 TaxID=2070463 RepID=UPI0010CCD9FF|nr:helix-turn-helix transcriptional regulator [Lysinibacillus sp. SGAir0095]QCR31341.1 transcriptional regulator [Lysinibacillus sp. SGAir0095]
MLKNRVKELRARNNFTQSDLGKLVGVTRQTIAFIEKGEFSPSITLALKLSKELKEPLEQIFWLEEDER